MRCAICSKEIKTIRVKGISYIYCCAKTQPVRITLRPKTIRHLQDFSDVILR